MEGFWRLGAAGLAGAYRDGRADPVAVAAELGQRIEALNGRLNAYVALAPDLMAQAEDSRDRLARGAARSALEGVPVAVKDNLVMRGLPAAWGGAVFGLAPCTGDELPVARLRAAGAILVGKTATPEFAVEGYTASRRFGVTRNPWNPALTPGGSSGGAVAAVAAGLAVAALGTDGGGSIRRPAGHTGLFGLKPGIGAVPRASGLPQILMDFEVAGPIARSVADLRAMFAALSGPDRADPASRLWRPAQAPPGRRRILAVARLGDAPCDRHILAAFEAAADRLAALGHEMVPGDLPLDLGPVDAHWGAFAQIGLAHLAATVPGMAERASSRYLQMAAEGAGLPAPRLFAAVQAVRELRAQASALFAGWDAILMPTAAAQPWPADQPYPDRIDGQRVGPRGHAIYTGWVNAAGHPAVALPAPPAPDGMPVGVQLIGDLGTEAMLLDLASALEAAGPGWRWPALAEG